MSTPAGVLDVPVFSDSVVPDESAVNDPNELHCSVCGVVITRTSNRGRPPTKCELHRGNKSSTTKRQTTGNDKLAAQATEVLVQINTIVGTAALYVGKLPMTATAIDTAEDAFREQVYAALLADPELCRKLLRAGTTSGPMALLIAYGMLAAAIGPVAVMEIRERREARAEMQGVEADSGGE